MSCGIYWKDRRQFLNAHCRRNDGAPNPGFDSGGARGFSLKSTPDSRRFAGNHNFRVRRMGRNGKAHSWPGSLSTQSRVRHCGDQHGRLKHSGIVSAYTSEFVAAANATVSVDTAGVSADRNSIVLSWGRAPGAGAELGKHAYRGIRFKPVTEPSIAAAVPCDMHLFVCFGYPLSKRRGSGPR